MRVLVTGAAGFVGRFLCPLLFVRGHHVTAAVRSVPDEPINGVDHTTVIGAVCADTNWSNALIDQDIVIHLVARTHVLGETNGESLYQQVNVDGTETLAKAAIKSGINRFLYLSSIKALAESSGPKALDEGMTPMPEDAYGRTKHQAEKILLELARETAMETTILRPPLVYGPGAKANLLNLIKACDRRLPLPVALIKNRRNLVYLGNLTDALICLAEAKGADGEIFHVCDGEAVSTPELVRRISSALGRTPRMIPVPVGLLKIAGFLTGKSDAIDRLTGSLEVNDDKLRRVVGWTPPYNMIQGLEQTAEWFHAQNQPKDTTN